jgi:hypothetical protein
MAAPERHRRVALLDLAQGDWRDARTFGERRDRPPALSTSARHLEAENVAASSVWREWVWVRRIISSWHHYVIS